MCVEHTLWGWVIWGWLTTVLSRAAVHTHVQVPVRACFSVALGAYPGVECCVTWQLHV